MINIITVYWFGSWRKALSVLEDNAHLISMVPVEELLRFGYELGLQEGDTVLDLCCGDVAAYYDKKYDVVICSETISSIPETLSLGKKFLKTGGVLAYQKLYSRVDNPPQELVDFDEEVLTLSELNSIFNQQGFQVTSMASDSMGMWEHYVLNWSGKRDLLQLSQNEMDENLWLWIQTWYNMYFKYRRQYEGQALFGA